MDDHGISLLTYHLMIYKILWDGTGHALGRKQRGNEGKQGMNYIAPSALGDGQNYAVCCHKYWTQLFAFLWLLHRDFARVPERLQ
jgi:hypothetical protein